MMKKRINEGRISLGIPVEPCLLQKSQEHFFYILPGWLKKADDRFFGKLRLCEQDSQYWQSFSKEYGNAHLKEKFTGPRRLLMKLPNCSQRNYAEADVILCNEHHQAGNWHLHDFRCF